MHRRTRKLSLRSQLLLSFVLEKKKTKRKWHEIKKISHTTRNWGKDNERMNGKTVARSLNEKFSHRIPLGLECTSESAVGENNVVRCFRWMFSVVTKRHDSQCSLCVITAQNLKRKASRLTWDKPMLLKCLWKIRKTCKARWFPCSEIWNSHRNKEIQLKRHSKLTHHLHKFDWTDGNVCLFNILLHFQGPPHLRFKFLI